MMPAGPLGGAAVDPATFRRALGRVPTSVSVIAAGTREGPAGLVVGSLVSISLVPPLIGIFVSESSTSWPRIEATGTFTANVLAHGQHELCARFARPGGAKFTGLTWLTSPLGNPLLPGVTGWIDCTLRDVLRIGDHSLAVGQVESAGEGNGGPPLVHHEGLLRALAPYGER
ncbi:flavin reductase family protein [Streptomyces glomeratus]|nr:flavin reductase family protein [Streptomyces glomeratus]MCF1512441.1 flavin reductase family protein [Streptomyces glomeratus]